MRKAPPLVCRHCSKEPSGHVVRKERLTCAKGGKEWEDTDDRQAWDILRQLDDLDTRQVNLRRRLFELTEVSLKEQGNDPTHQ
jgi:hypothetical protein